VQTSAVIFTNKSSHIESHMKQIDCETTIVKLSYQLLMSNIQKSKRLFRSQSCICFLHLLQISLHPSHIRERIIRCAQSSYFIPILFLWSILWQYFLYYLLWNYDTHYYIASVYSNDIHTELHSFTTYLHLMHPTWQQWNSKMVEVSIIGQEKAW